MKILHVSPSFYPATRWGGPIFSTKAICDGIAARPDMELRVLTTDAAGPGRADRLEPAVLPYPVEYARRIIGHSISPGLLARLPRAIAWADVVHLTATYSFPTLPTLALARLMGRPVVWSPRGALQATAEWADAPNRGVKSLFEWVARWVRPARTVLHVTACREEAQSATRLPGITTRIIPNAVDIPTDYRRIKGDGLRLVYLSRLHPKKGIDLLLDAMEALPRHVSLDVYGAGSPDYMAELRRRAAPMSGRVRFHGHVEDKAAVFTAADLFVLPSYSENFGIAVAEALAHAVPVITTTGTPWRDLDRMECGRCIDLQAADLATEIATLATYDLAEMGAKGREWMARDFSSAAMVGEFAKLYAALCSAEMEVVTA